VELKEKIRIIEDFPKKGISFKDVTPLLQDGNALQETIDKLEKFLIDKKIDVIVGPEARGFLFGVPVACKMGKGFVPIRKPGKLPCDTISIEYELEYGSNRLEMHKDAIKPGMRVAIIDDLLATGGTVAGTAKLIEEMGGEVAALAFVIELTDLKGREKLEKYDVMSLIEYNI
jgi:adenine phosphoribosyltransferase